MAVTFGGHKDFDWDRYWKRYGNTTIPIATSFLPSGTVKTLETQGLQGIAPKILDTDFLKAGQPITGSKTIMGLASGGSVGPGGSFSPVSTEGRIMETLAQQGISPRDPRHPLYLGGGGAPAYNPLSGDLSQFGLNLLTQGYGQTGAGAGAGSGGFPTPAKFSDFYQQPTGTADPAFQQLLGAIGAPSSVEEVQKGLESDFLRQTLEEIESETGQSLASTKLDFLERGLGGPGQISDIEAIALAQTREGGERTKAGARTQLGLAQLQREREREQAKIGAFGQQFQAATQADIQAKEIAARGALSDQDISNKLLMTGILPADTMAQLSSAEKRSLFDNLVSLQLGKDKIAAANTQQERAFQQEEYQRALGRLEKQLEPLPKQPEFLESILDIIGSGISIGTGLLGKGKKGGLLR